MSEQIEKANVNVKVVASIVIGVILFVAWFYNQVIIPIQNQGIQLQQQSVQLTQIQATLSVQSSANANLDTRVTTIESKLKIK